MNICRPAFPPPLFWPWFLFNWEYDSVDADAALSGPENRTVAEIYAEKRSSELDSMERRLIESINRKPYNFWEVLSVVKGMRIKLQNIFTGSCIEVQERSGTEHLNPVRYWAIWKWRQKKPEHLCASAKTPAVDDAIIQS